MENNNTRESGHITLLELTQRIERYILAMPDQPVWVSAEIASCSSPDSGHCYLDLVDPHLKGGKTAAKMRGNIWRDKYKILRAKFEDATHESLRAGMQVLLYCVVDFDTFYGLSLEIVDIDPKYTIGDLAQQRAETIERLKEEHLLDQNGSIPPRELPKRIAVISSAQAAGYGDFTKHIGETAQRYGLHLELHKALMQGERASSEIIQALNSIAERHRDYDVVVIIRGGGSQLDLSCFDDYELAKRIATMPIPVLTGIGHDRDMSVADMVANRHFKTPTAVAAHFVDYYGAAEQALAKMRLELLSRVRKNLQTQHLLYDMLFARLHQATEKQIGRPKEVQLIAQRLRQLAMRYVEQQLNAIHPNRSRIQRAGAQFLERNELVLDGLKRVIPMFDPATFLSRGYAMVLRDGVAMRSATQLSPGDMVQLALHDGTATAMVGTINIKKGSETR